MPRAFAPTADETTRPADIGAGAARLIAVALTTLLLSFLVLARSQQVLEQGIGTSGEIRAGVVALTDDDDGSTLFDIPAMAPGDRSTNCIQVIYDGTIVDALVGLRVRGGGPLASFLDTTIEVGRGGGFEDCDGFTSTHVAYRGSLARLVDQHGPSAAALRGFRVGELPDARTFRVTVHLDESLSTQGLTATADLVWTADG